MDWLSSDLYGTYREWMAVAEDERMYRVVADVSRAAELSAQRLGGMGDRWRHTQAVAARASSASPAVAPNDRDLLVAAAWLHDIGSSSTPPATGRTGCTQSNASILARTRVARSNVVWARARSGRDGLGLSRNTTRGGRGVLGPHRPVSGREPPSRPTATTNRNRVRDAQVTRPVRHASERLDKDRTVATPSLGPRRRQSTQRA
jgi:hypothetical protein